jgi:ferritin-like metal-binding protein YciE
MAMDSLEALFEDTLRDMYCAGKKLTKMLPKMAKRPLPRNSPRRSHPTRRKLKAKWKELKKCSN